MEKRQVVLASSNVGKLREIQAMLVDVGIELLPQSQFQVTDAEETGKSFVENAILKARHAAAATHKPAIADDSGIEVDVLQGAPGIYSARYAGKGATDASNLQKLLEDAFAKGEEEPLARFQCVLVYLRHAEDPVPVIAQGTWEGYLVPEAQGKNGFGYDPVFYVPEHQCTSAQLPPEVKNRISHRARAIKELIRKLRVN